MTPAQHEPSRLPEWPAGLWPLQPGVTLLTGEEGAGKTYWLRQLAALSPGPVATFGLGQPDEPPPEQTGQALLQDCARRWPTWDQDRAEELVGAWQLVPHLSKSLYMLSTGTRRKLGLVAAFAAGANWVLLDQPYAALDLPSQWVLTACLQAWARDARQTCVLADHLAPHGVSLVAQVTLAPRDAQVRSVGVPDGFIGRGA